MAYWLLKTEPAEFSWSMLVERGREPWTGVRNATALKNLRAMAPGDLAFIYHTGGEKQIVGIAYVELAAYPDPTAADNRFMAVDVAPVKGLGRPVTLAQIKADPAFADWALVRQSRLSVMSVPDELWTRILMMGETNQ
jgi:predicted RNA-binding protein with PUA-like domain